jgi:hypothetical protein
VTDDDEQESAMALIGVRGEALAWWQSQGFNEAVPTRILASTLLNQFVDQQLHPDPHVSEMLPRVLEKLFSEQVSAKAFMNMFLPLTGGYVDSRGVEVPIGAGLPLKTNLERCAESLLTFLRQWSDLVLAAEEEDWQKTSKSLRSGGDFRQMSGQLAADEFMHAVEASGHGYRDVVAMLEGVIQSPEEILNVPIEEHRYKMQDGIRRTWEILTGQFIDTVEMAKEGSRDLGPYLHVEVDRPETVAAAWGGSQPSTAAWVTNPKLAEDARIHFLEQHDDEFPQPGILAHSFLHASDSLSLTLVGFPSDMAMPVSTSTFVKFFAEGRRISRTGLQGLPPMPWTFGSDRRNTIVVDVPGVTIAQFHCMFVPSRSQPWRACVIPLGNLLSPTYLICPKYQPIEVHNGDRIVCHQWVFELRIDGGGASHVSQLKILTDEGEEFKMPMDGCHVGAGNRSKQIEHQPWFPPTKFPLKHRLRDMAAVQFSVVRNPSCDRWMLVDHSHDPEGTLLQLRTGTAYPLSEGMNMKLGPLVLEVNKPDGS